MLTEEQVGAFQDIVRDFYTEHKRDYLPWRKTHDPYHILVSELMLQQTQVDRVIPKFESFIDKWPTTRHLANASLGDILKAWQGLGYNRRAKFLHLAAKYVEDELQGVFPKTEETLRTLPGVGPYTASAVTAFAFNQKTVLIETNVRQVMIFHFFPDKQQITDAQILGVVEETLPEADFRSWYAALMDYGAYLKKEHGNLSRQARAYTKQSPFKGSDREIRGVILRELAKKNQTVETLQGSLYFDSKRLTAQLENLLAEELIQKKDSGYSLPN